MALLLIVSFFIVAILVGVTQYLVMVLICFLLKPSLDGRVSVHVPLPIFVFSLLHLWQQFQDVMVRVLETVRYKRYKRVSGLFTCPWLQRL